MKKRCIFSLTIMALLLLGPLSASTMDCETPPFVTTAVPPNVLIILDNSGSTLTEDVPGYDNRFHAAKTVIKQLLADPISEGFRWGLMRLDGSQSSGERSKWEWQHPDTGKWFKTKSNFLRHGGKLLRPVGTDRAEIIDYVDGMEVYDTTPHIYTVNAETLFTAAQYFAGGFGPPGLGTYKGDALTNYRYYDLNDNSFWSRDHDDWGNKISDFADGLASPIQHWCQKNFVIYLTDGESNCDSDWDRLLDLVGDYDGDGADSPDVDQWDETGKNNYMDDVAKWMYENDLRPDDDNLPGIQNVVTYVVGLKIDSQLLHDTGDENHGRGGFYYAPDYDMLKEAFERIVYDIIQRVSSGTAVAVQSSSTQGARRLLRAKFVPVEWTGHLEGFALPYTKGDAPLWDAGIELQAMNPDNRSIFTAVDDTKGPTVEMKRKVLFTEANSSTQDGDNNTLSDMLGAADDAEAKKIIRYLRGTAVGGYRVRAGGWKLGDIAYSSPVIWGSMAYVGANDGMLHAFDINTGEEKWAFIPNYLLGKVKDLTDPLYCHEYFVDLSPRVAEIYVGGFLKRILVGGLRGGGNAFFALDITDPSAAGVQPMWEFNDAYMGKSWSVPTIERCWLGGQERWVVFMGSAFGNKDTKGYLFAVDAITGEQIGNKKLLTGAPDNVLPGLRAIDLDGDSYADRIFVGCLQEKLYIVEIGPEADPNKWTSKHILSTVPGQPITVPTSLSLYREDGMDYIMAYFGTGKFYTLADKTDLTLQTFYAVKDNAVKVGKGGLADQTDAGVCADILGGFGWYIDLVEGPGERVVSSSMVLGGYVFFTTFQPTDDPCEAGGIARLYVIGYENGCVPTEPVIDLNGDGVVDENDKIGGVIPRTITIGYGVPSDIVFDSSESTIIIQTSDTTIHVYKVDVLSKRLTVHSWREVFD